MLHKYFNFPFIFACIVQSIIKRQLFYISDLLLRNTFTGIYCIKHFTMVEKVTKKIILEFIRKNEVELNASQTKLCLPIINRIFKKMSAGINFSAIKVENNLICDGHHRYLASLFANFFS